MEKDDLMCSGNIKLRIPKSMHAALIKQAEAENVSMNLLCIAYLSQGLATISHPIDMFNLRLEAIARVAKNDVAKIIELLLELNEEIEGLKKSLISNISMILKDADNQEQAFEALRTLYPIYCCGDTLNEHLPILKIPSFKVVFVPKHGKRISREEIERLFPDYNVSQGDYDLYVPIERREVNAERMKSIVIYPCDQLKDAEKHIQRIKETINLHYSDYRSRFDIVIKPTYNSLPLEKLLIQEYPETKSLF